jgi:pimeloyl-ACP methyl ester carboxylesterase
MLAVSAWLPDEDRGRPPVVLVHGAANDGGVWTFWAARLAAEGWPTYVMYLRGHGMSDPMDLSRTSMGEYVDDVAQVVGQLRQRPAIVGWSMGGLVAIMAGAAGLASACVGLAPSRPVQVADPSVSLREGEFGPEEYGITSHVGRDADGVDLDAAMPDLDRVERVIAVCSLGKESRYARDERQRGIVVDRLPCPLLIVTGSLDRQWPRARYADLHLTADYLVAEGASHWGLVLNGRVLDTLVPAVSDWLRERVASDVSS